MTGEAVCMRDICRRAFLEYVSQVEEAGSWLNCSHLEA